MVSDELHGFFHAWSREAAKTASLLRALPEGCYDFRPVEGFRSIGELAWHLAEGDAYTALLVAQGKLGPGDRPPGIERPREVAALAPGYERVHAESKARLAHLTAADLPRTLTYFDGSERSVSHVLWEGILYHHLHHRGQLSLMTRLAGGRPPGLYGPNLEETAAMRAKG
jgi:uncharacterized damage-inducible protein DinB